VNESIDLKVSDFAGPPGIPSGQYGIGVIVFSHLRQLLTLCYDEKNGGCMTIKMAPPEIRTESLSYANATWRDANNAEHTRYTVHAMKPGPGYEIIDTSNNANWSVVSNFATEADARERMRTKNVEIHNWRKSV
jgi:hypothetical protein